MADTARWAGTIRHSARPAGADDQAGTTGTHTGRLDLPAEHFEMEVSAGRVRRIVSHPPNDGGLSGLVAQICAKG